MRIPSDEELKILDVQSFQTHWVKLEILNDEELFIDSIEGKVTQGNLNIDGSSSMRRTLSFSFIPAEDDKNLVEIGGLLSLNRRIRVLEGIENDGVLSGYDDIIWIPQGIFVITQPNISHSNSGVTISLSCKDKMALLNGDCGGAFPAPVVFHEYDQRIGKQECPDGLPSYEEANTYTVYINDNKYWRLSNGVFEEVTESMIGTIESIPQRIYDIIKTAVCNYGGIPLSKIFINDVPLTIKQITRFVGTGNLFYDMTTGVYRRNSSEVVSDPDRWRAFEYNDEIGYVYTDYVFPGKDGLATGIGDTVCTLLDKIIEVLGNFEYFFDREGNFIFQEIKNYLNNSYTPIDASRIDNYMKEYINDDGEEVRAEILTNGLSILDDTNYELDVHSNTKSVYTFTEGNGLISSYSNSPNYSNICNDFHIWGKSTDGSSTLHYHCAIKEKPTVFNTYQVVFLKDDEGNYTGKLRLATSEELKQMQVSITDETLEDKGGRINGEEYTASSGSSISDETLTIPSNSTIAVNYTPTDWRAEIYLQGLTKQSQQIRPDVYEQELLDLFDSIYDFKESKFKMDIVTSPNDLNYFFDYLEPSDNLRDFSVDNIGTRVKSYQNDSIRKMFNVFIPNLILINQGEPSTYNQIIKRCGEEGQPFSTVENSVYKDLAFTTLGYTAQESMRDLLYKHTNYAESVSMNAVPIYHLEPNTRITIEDSMSNIHGDYIIKSISLPLGGRGNMTISATRALERI